MRLLILLITLAFNLLAATAQPRWNSTYQNYIDRYREVAIEQMLKHHIPASITMAQGLLESGAGNSSLATKGNNHFGIKCHGWSGARMYMDDDNKDDCFRVYRNALESYEDHSRFLLKPRYKSLFSLKTTDYKGWAKGLKACGYATNPSYAQQLISIIELYKLDELDKAKTYDKYIASHVASAEEGIQFAHTIGYNNKNYYIVVKKGDTFKSLSKEFDISVKRLANYNELNNEDVLHEGDIIYLKKKLSKADRVFKKVPHIVEPGESMYSISQKYGIRLKYLYKKNDLSPDYMPQVGDRLRVY